MTRLAYIFLLVQLLSLVNSKPQDNFNINTKDCTVSEVATGESKPCQSAFIIEEKTYYGCTTENSPEEGRAWCSTKVDITWHHEGGDFYGFCPDDNSCLTHEQGLKQREEMMKMDKTDKIDLTKTKEVCKCQSYSTCTWSNTMVDQLSILPRNNPMHKALKQQFQLQICDAQKKHVWCCRDGEMARGSELEILNAKEANDVCNSEDKECGKWKPDGINGECGKRSLLSNIVGGEETKLGDYPYMALIGYEHQGRTVYGCGGSLINKWYVLTAAHCFDEPLPVKEVVLGEHDTRTDPDGGAPKKITRKPAETIIHEGYESGSSSPLNDIALIRLDEPVPLFSEDTSLSSASPICLPWSEDDPARFIKEGDKAVVTGWGAASNRRENVTINIRDNGISFPVLLQVNVPVANEKCSPGSRFVVDDKIQICAGGETGKDSCNGDSGGPLAYREFAGDPWTQIGVVSYGTGVCGVGIPGVYTRIDGYLDWIESKLKP